MKQQTPVIAGNSAASQAVSLVWEVFVSVDEWRLLDEACDLRAERIVSVGWQASGMTITTAAECDSSTSHAEGLQDLASADSWHLSGHRSL